MEKILIANWKMYVDTSEKASQLLKASALAMKKQTGVRVILCSPAFFIENMAKKNRSTKLEIGVQNISENESGAHTGEISADMAYQSGARWVILGHSERRAMGETSQQVSKKVMLALKKRLVPVVCFGELERDQSMDFYRAVRQQLMESLQGIPKVALNRIVFAYEPVWSISANKGARPAEPRDVEEMMIFIKKVLSEEYGLKKTNQLTLIYGGSVKAENAVSWLQIPHVSGLLIGSASSSVDSWKSLIHCVTEL